eukprot:350616-Chlamydomonas_euryale.AAC.4
MGVSTGVGISECERVRVSINVGVSIGVGVSKTTTEARVPCSDVRPHLDMSVAQTAPRTKPCKSQATKCNPVRHLAPAHAVPWAGHMTPHAAPYSPMQSHGQAI